MTIVTSNELVNEPLYQVTGESTSYEFFSPPILVTNEQPTASQIQADTQGYENKPEIPIIHFDYSKMHHEKCIPSLEHANKLKGEKRKEERAFVHKMLVTIHQQIEQDVQVQQNLLKYISYYGIPEYIVRITRKAEPETRFLNIKFTWNTEHYAPIEHMIRNEFSIPHSGQPKGCLINHGPFSGYEIVANSSSDYDCNPTTNITIRKQIASSSIERIDKQENIMSHGSPGGCIIL